MSAFVPCIEDRITTAACRHAEPAQNILFAATRTAARALVRASTAGESDADPVVRARCNQALEDAYQALWSHRHQVPEGLRREWLEVALTLLTQIHPMQAVRAWWWWLSPTADAEDASTSEEARSPSSAPSPPARKVRSVRWRPWVLWEDARRNQTFLTLRTESSKYVNDKGLHLKLEAMRPEDVCRLDGPAFCARARMFLYSEELHRIHDGLALMTPPSALHVHESEMYQRTLRFLTAPTSSTETGEKTGVREYAAKWTPSPTQQRQVKIVSAALRYRVLIEVCALRLMHTPRCTVTWRLLVESVTYMLSRSCQDCLTEGVRASSSSSPREETQDVPVAHDVMRVVAQSVLLYTSSYLIPYLELRDRHAEGVRGSFHAVNAALFGAADARRGLWDCVLVDTTAGEEASAVTPAVLTPDAATAPTLGAYLASQSPACGADAEVESWTRVCADALEHIALAAANEGLHTAANLEAMVTQVSPPCSSGDDDGAPQAAPHVLREAVLSVLKFCEPSVVEEQADEAADLFLCGATRRRCLMQFVRRFYGCAPADAFERGGAPREADAS